MTTVEFFAAGVPAAQGSKRHVGGGRMVEQSKRVAPWRETVAGAARSAYSGDLLTGGLSVMLTFVMKRPVSAPKSLTPLAVKRPDLDKLQRSVFDALTGVVWADDSQVVAVSAMKRIAEIGERPGVHVVIGPMTAEPLAAAADEAAVKRALSLQASLALEGRGR